VGGGPFWQRPGGDGSIDADFGPDKTPGSVDLKAAYSSDGREFHWEQTKTNAKLGDGNPFVDFNRFCKNHGGRLEQVVGYFAVNVVSDADGRAQLLIGSDDGVKVWFNGKVVDRVIDARAVQFGDDLINVDLKKGANLLLCKLQNGSGPSGLCVAVAAEPGFHFSTDLTAAGDQAASGAESVPAGAGAAASQPAAVVVRDKNNQPYPSVDVLASMTGDAKAGAAVPRNAQGANCIRCHQFGDDGGMVGPPLTTIGQKLSKAQLYTKIFNPNSSILMGYEDWIVKTKDGDFFEGILAETTDEHVTIKDANGQYHDIPLDQVASKKMLKTSIMPEGLPLAMTQQDMVNLVEYLTTLKNKE
jgi:putative heme-binding domain-containing protein